jgi:hypothetical protein
LLLPLSPELMLRMLLTFACGKSPNQLEVFSSENHGTKWWIFQKPRLMTPEVKWVLTYFNYFNKLGYHW